jgi:nucleoid-associated protein YejK
MNLSDLYIHSVIVHDVPRRLGKAEDGLVLSDVESDIDQELKNFFRERINRSLQTKAYRVEEDPESPSPVPRHVRGAICNPKGFVAASRAIASHLWASQTGVNPGGLLVVALGVEKNAPCLAVIKLEREDALRIEPVGSKGSKTFDISHLKDLMLGESTRVFKAALMFLSDDQRQIHGTASDDQGGYARQGEIARFFLREFLGCKLAVEPRVMTKAFFEATQRWINEEVKNAEDQSRYEIALIADLNSQAQDISVSGYATRNLPADIRAAYKKHMRLSGVAASQSKDTSLIAAKLAKMTYRTLSGIKVSGDVAALKEHVVVESQGDSATIVITDKLREVRGGG